MRQFRLRVTEISTLSRQVLVRCVGDRPLAPAPGQVCLARRICLDQDEADSAPDAFLRVPVFPFETPAGGPGFCVEAGHPYARLEPGDALDLLGPCGRGFELPPGAGRVLLVAAAPGRLMGLLRLALERRLAVTFLFPPGAELPDLPLAVEIQRGPLTAELAAWADVVALDAPDPSATAREIRTLCAGRPAGYVQALVAPTMPCGVGACQACWVETGRGRRLACVDGPVFLL